MRRFFQIFWAILAAIIVVPVAGEWFVEFAKEKGLYEHPSENADAAMSWLSSLATQPAYWGVAGLAVGMAGGMWMDAVLKRREKQDGASISEADKQCLNMVASFILGQLSKTEERFIGILHTMHNTERAKIEMMFPLAWAAIGGRVHAQFEALRKTTERCLRSNSIAPVIEGLDEFLRAYRGSQDLLRQFIIVTRVHPDASIKIWIALDEKCADEYRVIRTGFPQVASACPDTHVFASTYNFNELVISDLSSG